MKIRRIIIEFSDEPEDYSTSEKRQDKPRKYLRDLIPDLLSEGPLTMKALAEILGKSEQAVSNALRLLQENQTVIQERSTFKGYKYQFRLNKSEVPS